MKRIAAIIMLLAAAAGSALANRVIDEVAWVVGDEPIFKSDIETEVMRLRYEKQTIDGDPYCVLPEQLAIQKLMIAQAKIDSVVVSASSVELQVEGRLKYFVQQIGSKEKVEEYFNKSMNQIREDLQRTVEDQLTMQEMQRTIVGSVQITPADVRRFYDEMPRDSIPQIQEKVQVQIITMAPEVTLAEEERIRSQLRDFTERVNSGEAEFSTLAILYSEDRASAMQGGELGFMSRGRLVPEFADAAWSLYEAGKISRIVKTEFGYHIIQLIERKNDQVNCRHILMIPKVNAREKQAAMAKLDSIADDIRKGTFTFEQAVPVFSEHKESRQNDGSMVNPRDGSTEFQLQDLPADVAKAVHGMKVGEISDPFIYTTETGRELVCIIRLKSKTPRHAATIEDDYQVLKNMITARRNKEVIDEWIKEKQRETYIYINPEYRDCQFEYPGWVKE